MSAIVICLGCGADVIAGKDREDHPTWHCPACGFTDAPLVREMQLWRISNFVLLGWSFGLYRKWWDGGLAGLSLVGMYGFYCVTNEWGLAHV